MDDHKGVVEDVLLRGEHRIKVYRIYESWLGNDKVFIKIPSGNHFTPDLIIALSTKAWNELISVGELHPHSPPSTIRSIEEQILWRINYNHSLIGYKDTATALAYPAERNSFVLPYRIHFHYTI